MLTTLFHFAALIGWLLPAAPVDHLEPSAPLDRFEAMYEDLGLEGMMPAEVFRAAMLRVEAFEGEARVLAIADMTRPSHEERLYVIDLVGCQLAKRTWVAHGQGTGELMAERFSNRHGSHQTSLGLYRVGAEILSPKHGPALLLYGLDPDVNDQALAREVIMHGADYVSGDFIAQHGRLGRSWGCPAVSRADMPELIDMLADRALLYIHGH
ncbi:MAG: murein L,D-transpeptidase catalytic domain family protein [Flavobacteriales bacterium]|nr:murein L,D-transpeptidase catalytic domain family protein [Flavobacteriales bacterium]